MINSAGKTSIPHTVSSNSQEQDTRPVHLDQRLKYNGSVSLERSGRLTQQVADPVRRIQSGDNITEEIMEVTPKKQLTGQSVKVSRTSEATVNECIQQLNKKYYLLKHKCSFSKKKHHTAVA
nr:hypothetical protein [Endozoicomonas sp.]